MEQREPWGWAGRVEEFLGCAAEVVLETLNRHLIALLGHPASASQREAWREEEAILREVLRSLANTRPAIMLWGLVLEYELHLEGGRRPDAVLHTGERLFVIEFKQAALATQAAIDQVNAYARDLGEYHKASHTLDVVPVLALTRASETSGGTHTAIVSPPQLGELLAAEEGGESETPHFESWLRSPYEPLPTLVEAARLIFAEQPLPRIRRAESAGIPEAVALLAEIAHEAERTSSRVLALVAGVPGAGKTLAGLQLVYDRLAQDRSAVFLSGNGPLVQVLRDALKNKHFVQDLHAFVTTFGTSTRPPQHHIIVFDEAQRAWDRGYMNWHGRGDGSEPDVLVQVGERLDGWCTLVGLVGDGQEIHSGEEAGLAQWAEAIRAYATDGWEIHAPPRMGDQFQGLDVIEHPELDLTVSLRSHRAETLHAWVADLLAGDFAAGSARAQEIDDSGFAMYVTRDLSAAKNYLSDRYGSTEGSRVGVLASSRTQRFLPPHGVDSSWPATKKVNFGHWYNRDAGEPRAGSNLDEVVTEFGCQGLELDMPLIAWGDDVRWMGSSWEVKVGRPRYRQEDPRQLRLNAYRVLLTRGRDGFVVFVPDDPLLDATHKALLAGGVRPLLPALAKAGQPARHSPDASSLSGRG
ncbi:DUF2075 domain-containing protein [Nocardioides humilatus]|uniref:DUF2075 domain-containing protein n=1 Tax=Nocardioides humilatus TaxID=2607660 RepID=A0A5B1LFU6_9ACTN|nr:DNA/RNA helicase domain-containing protein [Nocardioides humilatus]KAA1419214.1 DUF2075 domain-containing protein [Nocardioides humilatus]